MNALKKFLLLSASIAIFKFPAVCEAWDECTDTMIEMLGCPMKQVHIPKTCNDDRKSELMECAEKALESSSSCTDPTALAIIKHFISTYKQSDEILCESNLHSELTKSDTCVWGARLIAKQLAMIPPGALTDKGCQAMNSMLYVHAVKDVKPECFQILEQYLTALYSKSHCAHVPVQPPTQEEFDTMKESVMNLVACWLLHPELPNCQNYERMQCVNETSIKTQHDHFTPILKNFVAITKYTDRVICDNKRLQQDFLNNDDCWDNVKNVGALILDQVNGLLTDFGCKAVKYRENTEIARFSKHCIPLLLEYREDMEKVLPCNGKPTFRDDTITDKTVSQAKATSRSLHEMSAIIILCSLVFIQYL